MTFNEAKRAWIESPNQGLIINLRFKNEVIYIQIKYFEFMDFFVQLVELAQENQFVLLLIKINWFNDLPAIGLTIEMQRRHLKIIEFYFNTSNVLAQ